MKIFIETHGCSRRYAEIAKFRDYFKINGYEIADNPEKASYIVVTTCAFKKSEEDYSIKRIRALRKHGAKMLIYGCLPDIAPTRFKEEFEGLDFLAPKNIDRIDDYFEGIKYRFADIKDPNIIPGEIKHTPISNAVKKFVDEFEFSHKFLLRTMDYAKSKIRKAVEGSDDRFYLLICRGCLGKCSYCAIKHAVGPIRSKPVRTIMEEFDKGRVSGYEDFVILGDDVGAYGIDNKDSFPALLSELHERSNNGAGFHIEEIHPKWMILYKDDLLRIVALKKIRSIICPLQSGNNRILNLMKREHDIENILDMVSNIHDLHPGIKVSTQIIAGFPTETEEDFDESLDAVRRGSFDAVTIFPYDEKENTGSAGIRPKISEDAVKRRVDRALKYFRRHEIKALLSCPK